MLPSTVESADDITNKLGQVGDTAEQTAAKLAAATTAGQKLAATRIGALKAQADEDAKAFDRLAASIRAADEARVAMTDAKLARDLARINEDESTGKLTHAQAAEARFDAQQQADEDKTRIQLQGIASAQRTQRQRVAKAEDDVAGRQRDITDLTGQQSAAQHTADQADAAIPNNFADYTKATHDRQQALAAAQKELNDLLLLSRSRYESPEEQVKTAEPALNKISRLNLEQSKADEDYEAQKEALGKQRDDAKAEVARLAAEVKNLQADLVTARKNLADIKTDADDRIGALGDQARSIQETSPLRRQTAQITQRGALRAAEAKDVQERNQKSVTGAEGVAGNVADNSEALLQALAASRAQTPEQKAQLQPLLQSILKLAAQNESNATTQGLDQLYAALGAYFQAIQRTLPQQAAQIKELAADVKAQAVAIAGLTVSRNTGN